MVQKRIDLVVNEHGADKAARGLGKVDAGLTNIAKSALAAGAAYFSVRGIVAGMKSVVAAAGEQEAAEKQLQVALGRTSMALLGQAAALQQVSVYGDETIIRAQALIAAFVKDEEQIKAATKATLDLASAKGMDLVAAADLVAKTLGSSTNALSRYGIEVEGAVGSTERLDTLTQNLAKTFGGQAEAAAGTLYGSVKQAQNAIGDMKEALGTNLAPVVIVVAGMVKKLAEAIGGAFGGGGGESLASRFDRLNDLIREHADLSTNDLVKAYTAVGVSYDLTKTRAQNFLFILDEQEDAQRRIISSLQEVRHELEEMDRDYAVLETDAPRAWADIGPPPEFKEKMTDLTPLFDNFTRQLAAAAVYGKSMGDAVVSALRAIGNEILANTALYALLAIFSGGGVGAFLPFMAGRMGISLAGGGTANKFPSGGNTSSSTTNYSVNVSGFMVGTPEELGARLKGYIAAADQMGRA